MANFSRTDSAFGDTSETSQGQTNPWIADRSLGSVRSLLQLAESLGHLRKDAFLNSDDRRLEAYDCSPSLKMLTLLRETKNCRQQLEEANLEIQRRLQDRETQDVTHLDVIEQRMSKISELSSHLEELIKNKQALIARLQQPFVSGYIPVEMQYQRFAGDFLPRIVPTLSELPTQLENLEWITQLHSTAGDLGGILADVSSTLATHQAVSQGVSQVRESMARRLESQYGSVTNRTDS